MSIIITLIMSFMSLAFSPAAKAPAVTSFAPMNKSHGIAQLKTQTQVINGKTRLIVTAFITQDSSTPLKVKWQLPSGMTATAGLTEQTIAGELGKGYEFAIEVDKYFDVEKAFVTFEIKGMVNDHQIGSTAIFSNQESQSLETQMSEKNKDAKKRPVLQK